MYKLRPYQEKGVEACKRVLLSPIRRRKVVVAPTGSGKSILVAYSAEAVDYPLIVLQPSKELLKQNFQKYIDIGGKASIYSVSCKEFQRNKIPYTRIDEKEYPCQEIGKVTFATIGSIMKDSDKFKELGVKGMIIDESHLQVQEGGQVEQFIKKVEIKNVLGLTATPIFLRNSLAGSELKIMTRVEGKLFTDIEHVTQITELVENNYWSKLIYRSFKEDGSVLTPNSSGSDFTQRSQKEYYEQHNLSRRITWIVDKLEEQGIRKSILIFTPSIASAEELKNYIPNSEVVHSKTPTKERERIINDFKNLKIKVVINVEILAIGFDHPRLDTIITARPTMSMAIYYQIIGRLVRLHPDKNNGAVIDLSGNLERFGRIEDLNFENLEGYGWGMFKGDELISGYPLSAKKRPTKKSLGIRRGINGTVIFDFGKHEGKTVKEVAKEDLGYLTWMVDNFKFKGKKGTILKKDIKNYLKL